MWGLLSYPLVAAAVASLCVEVEVAVTNNGGQTPFSDLIGVLLGFAVLVAYVLITLRRIKDLGKSGWNILWLFAPIASYIFGLRLLFVPGRVKRGASPA